MELDWRLTDRDKFIAFLYGRGCYTQSDIGKRFGLSRERVRQIVLRTKRITRKRTENDLARVEYAVGALLGPNCLMKMSMRPWNKVETGYELDALLGERPSEAPVASESTESPTKKGNRVKVAILGSSGIIGQHLMLSVPQFIQPVFTSRIGPPIFTSLDVQNRVNLNDFLEEHKPQVIVNLLGQNNPDVVERDPEAYGMINVSAVRWLAEWCDRNEAHLIQVSSQAANWPVNFYGRQKAAAERALWYTCQNWTILRPTFVLGIRPFPAIGRENPAERMLSGLETRSVCNRFFSVSFAEDVAKTIWGVVKKPMPRITLEIGNPETLSRYDLALKLGATPERITHESLEGLAERPADTTYHGARFATSLTEGLRTLKLEYEMRERDDLWRKSAELAAFLRKRHEDVLAKLSTGFSELHNAVTDDFKRAFPSGVPHSHEALLDWYRKTEAYLWELTCYHTDVGWNYQGMIGGIVTRLKNDGMQRVLCLGDGTGDLTLACHAASLKPTYNDLGCSKISAFAQHRFAMRGAEVNVDCGMDFDPIVGGYGKFDAIVSLDFLEHVPNVRAWCEAIHGWLKPGGLFCAQNAFGLGSGPDGAMPMHLQENDQWVELWDPMLREIGFTQLSPQWYRKELSEIIGWRHVQRG